MQNNKNLFITLEWIRNVLANVVNNDLCNCKHHGSLKNVERRRLYCNDNNEIDRVLFV